MLHPCRVLSFAALAATALCVGGRLSAAGFGVTVGGAPVRVETMRCSAMPVNIRWPGHQREKDQTELCGFARFDLVRPVEVAVVPSRAFTNAVVRPRHKGVRVRRDGNGVRFVITSPGAYSVEFDGRHENLMVFADPPRDYSGIDRTAANVRYYGPGEHNPGLITLAAGETLFLDEGAVVYGRVEAQDAKGVRICGRGILDASKVREVPVAVDPRLLEEQRKKGWAITNVERFDAIRLMFCDDARIEGITVRDSQIYAIRPVGCVGFTVDNVKVLGSWRYNSDGIDMHNCRRVRISDSFIRTFDDSICVKGFDYILPESEMLHGGVLHDVFEDVLVERCTIWNDWGRALEIGAETRAREIRNVVFRDCDILAVHEVAMDVQNCDQAHVHDIVFDDIRVEYDPEAPESAYSSSARDFRPASRRRAARLAEAIIHYIPEYSKAGAENRGRISDVVFRNVDVYAPTLPPGRLWGFDDAHRVERVRFAGIRLNGKDVTDVFVQSVQTNAFCGTIAQGKRWYKGMLHCHSYWSDGRAFPEQAVSAYRELGYDFVSLSDHNRLEMDKDEWRPVCEKEGKWPPAVIPLYYDNVKLRFPWIRTRPGKEGGEEVRITPYSELLAHFNEPGRFLLIPGTEITRGTADNWSTGRQVHINYHNLDSMIPSARSAWLIQNVFTNDTASTLIRSTVGEVEALAKASGATSHLVCVNHPHWPYYDIVPQDLVDNGNVRYFEVCNNGAEMDAPPELWRYEGYDTDRLWDVVNAFRARAGKPLLYGLASDDAHWYSFSGATVPETCRSSYPGDGWIRVRADALTPSALFAAMDRGDF